MGNGNPRKWIILAAVLWIQAFAGTNFDFSAYSTDLKSVLGVSQVQLNYLAMASDVGKLFGWSSGVALVHLPIWMVLLIAAFMGFFGYGFQWLVIRNIISLSYYHVFALCLLSGCSICWFNTVSFVLCAKNFPTNRSLAFSLTVSFHGLSAAFYGVAAKAINPSNPEIYLLLNAIIPLLSSLVGVAILLHIILQVSVLTLAQSDSMIFLVLNFEAVIMGVFLLLCGSYDSISLEAFFHLGGAIFFLILPLYIPGFVYGSHWLQRTLNKYFGLKGSNLHYEEDDSILLKEVITPTQDIHLSEGGDGNGSTPQCWKLKRGIKGFYESMMIVNRLETLCEEHTVKLLVRRLDFWLYYLSYFCGATICLVYINNLGQIAQSMGQSSSTYALLTLYSFFSFIGRILSAAPEYLRTKFDFSRTAWLLMALSPIPVSFFMLAGLGNNLALHTSTALIGLSSGFIFAASVSITSELFGPNSVGVNHNLLITNIPIGSFVYGLLAAIVYDSNADFRTNSSSVVCIGRQCYYSSFMLWGCISVLGVASSTLLFLRTKQAYGRKIALHSM